MATETTAATAENQAAPAAPAPSGIPPELASAIAAHSQKLGMAAETAPAAQASPAAPAAEAIARATAQTPQDAPVATDKTPGEQPAPEKAGEQPGQATEAAKPPEPEAPADAIARYLRQTRAAKEAEQKYNAELQAAAEAKRVAEAQRQEAEAAKAAAQAEKAKATELFELAKKDPSSAIRRLVGDKTLLDSTAIIDLIEKLKDGEPVSSDAAEPQLTEEQRMERTAKLVTDAIKAQQEVERQAAEEKAQKEAQEASQRGREAFFTGLNEQFKQNADKYPFLAAEAVPTKEVDAWMQQQYQATMRIPSPEDTLAHFEGVQKARAERLAAAMRKSGLMPAQPAATPQAATPGAGIRTGVDSRGTPPTLPPDATLKDERAAIVRRLEQLAAANRH